LINGIKTFINLGPNNIIRPISINLLMFNNKNQDNNQLNKKLENLKNMHRYYYLNNAIFTYQEFVD
jgi:hypothetical protein